MSRFILRKSFVILSLLSLAVISLEINENNNSFSPSILAQNAKPSKQQLLPLQLPSLSQSPSPTPNQQLSPLQMASSTNESCLLTPSLIESEGTPQQTEGPYFVAGMPLRSNITYDTSDDSIQQGLPLHIMLHIFTVNGTDNILQNMHNSSNNNIKNTSANICTPLSGARVDLWHANSQGVYSGIQNQDTVGKNFLRGYQITDKNGTVSFNTIYPGWYQGRAIHIHMKVSTFEGPIEKSDWTSQLYLNDSVNQQVHTQPPYSNHGPVPITNEQDLIYAGPSTDGLVKSDTGKHLMLNLVKDKQGYTGAFDVVLNALRSTK